MPLILVAAVVFAGPEPALRLPAGAVPIREEVALSLDPHGNAFTGLATLDVELERRTNRLRLNAKGLTELDASVLSGATRVPATVRVVDMETIESRWSPPLQGAIEVEIKYAGVVSPLESQGVFRQSIGPDGYLYSQFEPSDARQAFPCFDDPQFRIPWQLSIEAPADQTVVSNTPPVSSERVGDRQRVLFAETLPLPSYLVAFAVGPFEEVDGGTAGRLHTPIRYFIPRGSPLRPDYAVLATPRILAHTEDYFDIPYPYGKLDFVAIPSIVGWAAMENAGLITIANDLLAWRPEDDALDRRRAYASTAAHEIAHQWFGNLVTLPWWDDIWLNESFASWLEGKVMTELEPGWGFETARVAERGWAMEQDTLTTSRRIRQPIKSADDVATAFDGITYQKGSAVLAMLEAWIGAERFREGVRSYVREHANGTGRYADFVAALSRAAGRDVSKTVSGFVDQVGVPLVRVEMDCSAMTPTMTLTPSRFFPLGSPAPRAQKWDVPVCWSEDGGERRCTLLAEPATLAYKSGGCPTSLNLDAGATGYYRVDYPEDLLGKLLVDGSGVLSQAERVGVVEGAAAMVEAGRLAPSVVLSEIPALARSPSPELVRAAVGVAASLDDTRVSDSLRPEWTPFVQSTFAPAARDWGFAAREDDAAATRLGRPALIGLVGGAGDDASIQDEAARLADRWLTDRTGVDPEMVPVVLRLFTRRGDRPAFDRIVAQVRSEPARDRREQLLSALGAFEQPELTEAALELALDPTIDVREAFGLLFSAFGGVGTKEAAWIWLERRVDALAERVPVYARAYIVYTGAAYCDADHLARLDALFKRRAKGWLGAGLLLAQTRESVTQCIAARAQSEGQLRAFLASYRDGAPTSRPAAGP